MQKFYPEVELNGEFFSPRALVQKFNVHVELANEKGDYNKRLKKPHPWGCCFLRPDKDINGTKKSILYLLEQYERIYMDGLEKNGIEEAVFYLVVSSLQHQTSIPCIYLQKIVKYFEDFNISMVSDEPLN